MAPDRGNGRPGYSRLGTAGHDAQRDPPSSRQDRDEGDTPQVDDQDDQDNQDGEPPTSTLRVAKPGPDVQGRSFTLRAIAAGLLVGLVICFSNMYFGLQTGWVSMMTMPASLMGFGIFKTLSRHLSFPFSPVENVLVQTVAGSMAIMPLGCGFVGVLPAMQYLLKPEEQGPVNLGIWKLVVWSLGLCYFGVVFAVPLRRQVIIREKLKFPSGFSTAVLISVLHGKTGLVRDDSPPKQNHHERVVPEGYGARLEQDAPEHAADEEEGAALRRQQWKANVRLLLTCFFISGLYTFATYFFPILRDLPIFGTTAASTWLWTLNPSLAYVGQGIIMGPATTIHMVSLGPRSLSRISVLTILNSCLAQYSDGAYSPRWPNTKVGLLARSATGRMGAKAGSCGPHLP
jgi:OPT family oligopeptide transporter